MNDTKKISSYTVSIVYRPNDELNGRALYERITEKAYKDLSATARKQAEAALLKANPELKTLRAARKGHIVRIPAIPEGGKPDRRGLVDPIEDIAIEMADNLKLFEKSLSKKFADLEGQQKNFVGTLKAANKELKTYPNGAEAAKTLTKHLAASKKSNDANKELSLDALKKLRKIVEDFDY